MKSLLYVVLVFGLISFRLSNAEGRNEPETNDEKAGDNSSAESPVPHNPKIRSDEENGVNPSTLDNGPKTDTAAGSKSLIRNRRYGYGYGNYGYGGYGYGYDGYGYGYRYGSGYGYGYGSYGYGYGYYPYSSSYYPYYYSAATNPLQSLMNLGK